ncbi:hypothetical protein IIB51_03005 [Patescibacteria group bacterium]|nr:hypothetical protein [Patescibacteria group bacterium]
MKKFTRKLTRSPFTYLALAVFLILLISFYGGRNDTETGNAGIETIAGVDADNNGIRDDIDIFIATRYGTDANAAEGARISARGHQKVLITDPSQPDQARAVLEDNGDAGICAGRMFRASGLSSSRELNEIYLRTYNTTERLLHAQRIKAAGGLFERSVTSVVCP